MLKQPCNWYFIHPVKNLMFIKEGKKARETSALPGFIVFLTVILIHTAPFHGSSPPVPLPAEPKGG